MNLDFELTKRRKMLIFGLVSLAVLSAGMISIVHFDGLGLFEEEEPEYNYTVSVSGTLERFNLFGGDPVKDRTIKVGNSCRNPRHTFTTNEDGYFNKNITMDKGEKLVWCVSDYQTQEIDSINFIEENLDSYYIVNNRVILNIMSVESSTLGS